MLPGGFGNLYGLTPAQVAALANKEYSYGANQMVFHGLPYPTIPPSADGTIVDSSASWPGFHAFSAFIGEAFGPRQPTWTMERDISGYYARTAAGAARRRRSSWTSPCSTRPSNGGTPTLDGTAAAGRGHELRLRHPRLAARPAGRGRTACSRGSGVPGPGRRGRARGRVHRAHASVAWSPTGSPSWSSVTVRSAHAGTPPPQPTPRIQDAIVEQIFDEIVASPNGHRATGPADAVEVLQTEGVRADAAVENGRVKAVHRRTGDIDLYALVNRAPTRTSPPRSSLTGPVRERALRPGPVDRRGHARGVFDRVGRPHDARGDDRGRVHRARRLAGRRFTGSTVPDRCT